MKGRIPTSGAAKRFEDLIAWQRARGLTKEIYRLTSEGPLARDFELRSQLRRAAVSVMSNIAEGFERGKPTEFHQFVSVAKASCAELRSQLYVAVDVGYLDQAAFRRALLQAEQVGEILGALRASIERRRTVTK